VDQFSTKTNSHRQASYCFAQEAIDLFFGNLFFTSNPLSMELDSRVICYSYTGDAEVNQPRCRLRFSNRY
jgi:hypothetical protein